MLELKQTETFRKWRTRLKDERARALIASRLDRLAYGHTGDARRWERGSVNCVSIMVSATVPGFKGGAIRCSFCFAAEIRARRTKISRRRNVSRMNGVTEMAE